MIKTWHENGYSLWSTLTEALLKLDNNSSPQSDSKMSQVLEILDEINQTLKSTSKEPISGRVEISGNGLSPNLSAGFLTAMKIAVKPGIHLNHETPT